MKNILLIIISLVVAIYHIKSTDYSITVYLVQFILALLTFSIIVRIRGRSKEEKAK